MSNPYSQKIDRCQIRTPKQFLGVKSVHPTIIAFLALMLGMFWAPIASKGFNEFNYKYLNNSKVSETQHIYRQINDSEYIYVSNFDPKTKRGNNFTLEHFEENKLAYKISASAIKYVDKDSSYNLTNYNLRIIGSDNDQL